MFNTKELPTHYTDLPDSIKRVPLENMFNKLEEFQEQKQVGLLSDEELYRMRALERCIELRLTFELRLEGFTSSENSISEISGDSVICLKRDELKIIEQESFDLIKVVKTILSRTTTQHLASKILNSKVSLN